MGLVYVLSYQHHDPGILIPVAQELVRRGHNILGNIGNLGAFLEASGPKAALLVADVAVYGHAEGQAVTKLCRIHNIQSVSIQHGIPGNEEYHQHTANTLCLWGEVWAHNFHADRTVVTGNPAADVIAGMDINALEATGSQRWGVEPKALLLPSIRPDVTVGELAEVGEDPMDRARFYVRKAKETGWNGTWLVRPHPSDVKFGRRMAAYEYIAEALPAILQHPEEHKLYDVFPCIEYVFGTSTAALEGALFGCQVETVNMPFVPNDTSLEAMFYQVDGKAAARVADVVEEGLGVC